MRPHHFFRYSCVIFFSLFFCINSATGRTVKYTYDTLGRLTFVEDPGAGNRDYDYDKAGNRLNVAVSEATDQASEPGSPTIPTGLQTSHIADCAHSATWNASTSATGNLYYRFRESNGTETNITVTTFTVSCPRGYPNSNKPKSVRACNNIGCSVQAYF